MEKNVLQVIVVNKGFQNKWLGNTNKKPQQMQAELKISFLEDTLNNFIQIAKNGFLEVNMLQGLLNENHEETMQRLEAQIKILARQITALTNTKGNCDAIELRNRIVLFAPNLNKGRVVVENTRNQEKNLR